MELYPELTEQPPTSKRQIARSHIRPNPSIPDGSLLRGPGPLAVLLLGVMACLPAAPLSASGAVKDSVEIRWFFEGPLPDPVVAWFERAPDLAASDGTAAWEERRDLYLLAAGSSSLSPKLRGGGLEIKLRSRSSRLAAEGGEGWVEHWTKWRWSYTADQADVDAILRAFAASSGHGTRVAVSKRGRDRTLAVVRDGALSTAAGAGPTAGGLELELAGLRWQEEVWWTIALEVFGPLQAPLDHLREGLDTFFRDYPGPALTLDASSSFPAWLGERSGDETTAAGIP